MKSPARIALVATLLGAAGQAHAQPQDNRSYAEEPTNGVNLPAVGLAGDQDALSVSVNPAGLYFLSGGAFGLALDGIREQDTTTSGEGFGLYYGQVLGGRFLPRLGLGLGVEALRASRVHLDPDPGTPTRLTLATAMPLGRTAALGLSWHRFFDDSNKSLSGVSTWDLGLSARFGAHLAAGMVIRDLASPTVAGVPVQRRYEAELVGRPLATDRLELALGGRIGETRADVDGWLRWSVKVTRGLYFRGDVGTRELHVLTQPPTGSVVESDERDYQLTAGVEVSLGGLGASIFGSGRMGSDHEARLGSGTLLVRLSQTQVPSILPAAKHLEKLELSGGMSQQKHTLVIARLMRMARDPSVVGLVVQLDDVSVGWATARELRNQLLALRTAGKKVFAYMVVGNARDYFIGSAADKVYVDPAGGVYLQGFAATQLFVKDLFDKLGVSAQFEKIGEYKSAPEMFTRADPSAPALGMRNALYDSMFDTLIADISATRGLTPDKLRAIIDQGPFVAGDLAGNPLVDAVAEPDEVSKLITKEMGGAYPVAASPRERSDRWAYPKIAVIHVEGDIVDGKSQTIPLIGRRTAGSETIINALTAARADPEVVAIVLRIDSPGGSAVASELISREVFATRKVKPIICSMGDLAASGGYFIAAGCDKIFADPMTITGSIGIFFGKFDISGLASRLGVTWSTYVRGKHADIDSMFRPYTDAERTFLMGRLRYLYGRFVGAVAKGRGMKPAEVDAVGRGHVWSGAAALPIHLVDQLGGVADALTLAKQRAGLRSTDLVELELLPKPEPGLLQKLTGLPGSHESMLPSAFALIPGGARLLQALPASLVAQPDAPQARLPFEIIWNR